MVDVLLLVSNTYPDDTVIIEDSSFGTTERIRVVFEKGKLVSVEPATAVVFLGGG